jgi:hypothetical protein
MKEAQINFKFIDSQASFTHTVKLTHTCSWKSLIQTLKQCFTQLHEEPYLSLIDSQGITCHNHITESYVFWGLYDSVYSQDDGSLFLISNSKIVKICFFLNFDLSSHFTFDILSNSSWENILNLVYSKFENFNTTTVKKITLMNSSEEHQEIAFDTESFWSLYWKHRNEKATGGLALMIYASKCYHLNCQWGNSPSLEGIALISEDSTFPDTCNALLAALRLVSTEKLEKIFVVDHENDPIGSECLTTQILLRRYNKHCKMDNGTKVLVMTRSLHPNFSNPTFDSRTSQLSENNTDFLGTFFIISLLSPHPSN